jgi:hypothetical protein
MRPETENGVTLPTHEIVALAVMGTTGVLAAIDFDDELGFSAAEVGEVGPDRLLSNEVVAA